MGLENDSIGIRFYEEWLVAMRRYHDELIFRAFTEPDNSIVSPEE